MQTSDLRCLGWLAASIALVGAATAAKPAYAVVAFGDERLLDSDAPSDSLSDHAPSLASDGNGNWIVAWYRDVPGNDVVLAARSTDGGDTWSAPVQISDAGTPKQGESGVEIATDGQGSWVAAWISSGATIVVARSTDLGASWSTPQVVGGGVPGFFDRPQPDLAAAPGGPFVLAFGSSDDPQGDTGADFDIFATRSTDGGASWSPAVAIAPDAAIDGTTDVRPRLATDAAGAWVLTYTSYNPDDTWDDFAKAIRSTDDAISWLGPAVLETQVHGFNALATNRMATDVATDGSGLWMAVWSWLNPDAPGPTRTSAQTEDVRIARSVDGGATWTAPEVLNPNFDREGSYDGAPGIVAAGDGLWVAMWVSGSTLGGTIETDLDLLLIHSLDDGASWSRPAALAQRAVREPDGQSPRPRGVVYDGVDTWLAVWASHRAVDLKTLADRELLVSHSTRDCPPARALGCTAPLATSSASVRLLDRDGGRDRLQWQWKKGTVTDPAEFGDPTSGDDYALCIYDTVASVDRLRFEADVPGGASCDGRPCWSATRKGFVFRDRHTERGAIRLLRLQASDAGRAKLVLKGGGASLAPPRPPLSLDADVSVQLLHLSSGRCWEATFSTARDDEHLFSSKSD